ncbi:tripartite tricarboxylate transporter TctB family protein [Desertibacillus haloalkaliphilus]|uniref:tripartite tricarboxylate transporter TctB family protein n=1 Tax=Desertibacillus haloalkaliphilus TaxID=1328930 RepID=UPI001C2774FE|nr:tripartite tricarboxylate transporter TctB family protein [Desertibacillus haloalkaliphilus]MBU8906000.1 tripartite tricarboxylate transporter TctB family protein [Desertibacillus haloalkaliphilus]
MKKKHASLLFLGLLFLLFVWMAVQATSFQTQASYFPLYIALLASVLTIVATIRQIVQMRKEDNQEPFHENMSNVIKYTAWLIGYLILIYLVGLVLASIVYLFTFLLYEARLTIVKSILSTGVATVVVILISRFMELEWPSSLFAIF